MRGPFRGDVRLVARNDLNLSSGSIVDAAGNSIILSAGLRVSGRQPVFVQDIERINGVPPTIYPCVRGSGIDPCPAVRIGSGSVCDLSDGASLFMDTIPDWTESMTCSRSLP